MKVMTAAGSKKFQRDNTDPSMVKTRNTEGREKLNCFIRHKKNT